MIDELVNNSDLILVVVVKIQIKALCNNGELESGIGVTFRFAPNKHVPTNS